MDPIQGRASHTPACLSTAGTEGACRGDTALEPEAALELERFLPYRLSVLSNRIGRALAVAYQARFGVSIPEWRVMAVLGRFQTLSASEVAGRTRMDKVKVSRAIAAMERKGLVQRATDQKDQRMIRLALTEAGRAMHGEIAAVALRWERELLACLDEPARQGLEGAIASLSQRLDAFEAGEKEEP
jgi:DNA-binding MarR family transcriptional regulator